MKKNAIASAALAVALAVVGLASFDLAAQTVRTPAAAGQAQHEEAATSGPEAEPVQTKPARAQPESQTLEEAITRVLQRQGIDVRIIDDEDPTESEPAQVPGLPPLQADLFTKGAPMAL